MTFNLKRIHKAVNWNKEDDGFTQAFWEQNVKQFWLPEEISVSKDLKCWSMLSELAIPFFVLSGNIMAKAGISRRLIDFVDTCVGHKKGGIAIVMNCSYSRPPGVTVVPSVPTMP